MEHPRADSERGGDAGGDGMNTLILYANPSGEGQTGEEIGDAER